MGADTNFLLTIADSGGEALVGDEKTSLYADALERGSFVVRFVDEQSRYAVRITDKGKQAARNLKSVVMPEQSGGGDQPEPRLIRSPSDAETVAAEWMAYWAYSDVGAAEAGPDGGVDVRSAEGVAQVKAEMRPVGRPVVQQLAGIALHEQIDGLVFSLSGYTDEAKEWAAEAGIALFEFDLQGTPEPINASARRIADSVVPYEWRAVQESLDRYFFSGAVYLDEDGLPDVHAENRVYEMTASDGRRARIKVMTSLHGFIGTRSGLVTEASIGLALDETENAPRLYESSSPSSAFEAAAWLARYQGETGIDPMTWDETDETRAMSEIADRERRPWLLL